MFKLIQDIDTQGPVLELSRCNNIIRASDGDQGLVEIDLKHELLVKQKLKYPPINVKLCNWDGRMQYFITTINKIQRLNGDTVSESNSKAEFTGLLDSLGESLLFSKFHHNFNKHSINYLWQGNKKIVKLTEQPIKKLVFNPFNCHIIYSVRDIVASFDINEPEKETLLFKKSTFLHDSTNLYYLFLNLQNKSKNEYECGIFDFRNGKNTDSWISKDIPLKVEAFNKILTVATANAIEIFDIRKLIKPIERDSIDRFRDFLYDPNLNRLFVGCDNKMRIYRAEY